MGFFSWVRSAVRSAVLAGFQDAVEELEQVKGRVEPTVLQLDYTPNGEAEEPITRRGKRSVN